MLSRQKHVSSCTFPQRSHIQSLLSLYWEVNDFLRKAKMGDEEIRMKKWGDGEIFKK
jgi:hypothetical protein